MKIQIRDRDRRALLLLGGAAVLYAIVAYVVLPEFDALKLGAVGAQEKEAQLSKYRRAMIRKGHYTQLLEQARKDLIASEGLFIRGDNPTLAAVELQNIVEGAAQKVGLALGQRNVSSARKKDEFFNEITMTVAFEASPAQLASFLAELRSSPKVVVVRNAQIAPSQVLQEAPEKGGFNKLLRANVTIAAGLPLPPRKNG